MRRAYIRYTLDRMQVSLWFMPLLMALAAFPLSWLMVRIDARIPNTLLEDSKLIITGTASEMRTTMLGISGTILATTGVVFSLLTLPLSTVASQYGSRLLRIFLRDRTTQFVLGIFVGTFCYCMAIALSIPTQVPTFAAPQVSTTFALILTLISFATLILLIQHISTMLQAPNIVAAAGEELIEVIGFEIQEEDGKSHPPAVESDIKTLQISEAFPILAYQEGYIQLIDPQIIMNLAQDRDLIVLLQRKPGQFVWIGETIALVWPAEKIDGRLAEHLLHAFQIGNQRTPTQDVKYAVNQLVEIAVRAMSPAINDPFTAMTCLDYLGQGLVLLAQKERQIPKVYDKKGMLRLVFEPVPYTQLFDTAFDMLRHSSNDNARVLLHMLSVIEAIGRKTKSPEMYLELAHQVELVEEESQAGALIEKDRQAIQRRSDELQKLFVGHLPS